MAFLLHHIDGGAVPSIEFVRANETEAAIHAGDAMALAFGGVEPITSSGTIPAKISYIALRECPNGVDNNVPMPLLHFGPETVLETTLNQTEAAITTGVAVSWAAGNTVKTVTGSAATHFVVVEMLEGMSQGARVLVRPKD